MIKTGRIIKIISNQYTVNCDTENIVCLARGKFKHTKDILVVGDIVNVDIEKKTIESIEDRKNFLTRPFVSNVDIALIVTSLKMPDLSLSLLDKQLAIILLNQIEPVICFSKIDLLKQEELREFNNICNYYESIGYKVFINTNIAKLKSYLKNKVVVVTGQTGAGKSTLLNKMDQNLNLETKPISKALNRGVHTTRHVELYEVDNFYIVDTPGFSALDFPKIPNLKLADYFIEFKNYQCRFQNCQHKEEIGCGVREAKDKGLIKESRYNNYIRFLGEIDENNRKLYK